MSNGDRDARNEAVSFDDVRPVWHVMDDRDAVPLCEPRRVRTVPECEEGGKCVGSF